MGLFADVGGTICSVVLMQANLERLERNAERQDRDIAGLRDVIIRLSERLVRIETMIEMSGARSPQPRIEG